MRIPIIALDGTTDGTIPRGWMKGWARHTTGPYRHVAVKGDHYFVSTEYSKVRAGQAGSLLGPATCRRGRDCAH